MTETTQTPFSGIMVKARKMPDLMYPRFEKWYNTSTYISTSTTTYLGHPVAAGRNFVTTGIVERPWHVSDPPARALRPHSATVAMDITTPAYMLAGLQTANQSTTEDTIVGLDYFNPPLRLYKDLEAIQQHTDTTDANNINMHVRVLAIKHKLTFINHSRFPLEVYWAILPVGHLWPVPTGQFAPLVDIMSTTYTKVTIPAIRDAGDRGQKGHINIDINLKRLWPHEYDMTPGNNMTSTTAALSVDNGNSPWIAVVGGTGSASTYLNMPAGQVEDDSKTSVDVSLNGPTCGLRLQWYCKLQNPRDLGITTEDADHSGGDYTGNSYDVHANMGWLVDIMRTGNLPIIHGGELAYPSTAA